MAEPPIWALRSDIWGVGPGASATTDSAQELRSTCHVTTDTSEAQGDSSQRNAPEQRLVIEIWESYEEMSLLPRLEVRVPVQNLSDEDRAKIPDGVEIGKCVGILVDRSRIFSNPSITTQNLSAQVGMFVHCAYDSSGALKPEFIEHAHASSNHDGLASACASPTSNSDAISERSFVLIEKIEVCTPMRRRGYAREMLHRLLMEAVAIIPDIAFAVSWPYANDYDVEDLGFPPLEDDDDDDENYYDAEFYDGSAAAATMRSRAGTGQQRAEAFHAAMGFRRLGLTRWWAKPVTAPSIMEENGEGSSRPRETTEGSAASLPG